MYAAEINARAGASVVGVEPCEPRAARCLSISQTDPFVVGAAPLLDLPNDDLAQTRGREITFSSRLLRHTDGVTLRRVLLHEIGHALGAHHSSNPHHIMHELGGTDAESVALSQIVEVARHREARQ